MIFTYMNKCENWSIGILSGDYDLFDVIFTGSYSTICKCVLIVERIL